MVTSSVTAPTSTGLAARLDPENARGVTAGLRAGSPAPAPACRGARARACRRCSGSARSPCGPRGAAGARATASPCDFLAGVLPPSRSPGSLASAGLPASAAELSWVWRLEVRDARAVGRRLVERADVDQQVRAQVVADVVEPVGGQRAVVGQLHQPLDAAGLVDAGGQAIQVAGQRTQRAGEAAEVADQRPRAQQRRPTLLQGIAEGHERGLGGARERAECLDHAADVVTGAVQVGHDRPRLVGEPAQIGHRRAQLGQEPRAAAAGSRSMSSRRSAVAAPVSPALRMKPVSRLRSRASGASDWSDSSARRASVRF